MMEHLTVPTLATLLALAAPLRAAVGQDPVGHGPPDAADTVRLGLTEAAERALDYYPAIAVSSARTEAAAAVAGRAAAARWPRLSLGLQATRYEEPMIVTPIHGFAPGTTPAFDETLIQGWTTLEYSLFDGGARGGRIREARAQSAAAEVAEEGARQAVLARVVGTYLETLSRRDLLAAHERRIAALREERDRVRQRLDVGRAARIELLRLQATLASAEADRVRAAADLDVAHRELARLIGASADETAPDRLVPVEFVGPAAAPRDELLAAALAANPRVEELRRERVAAEAAESVARGVRWPKLDLAGTYIDRGSADGDFTGEWDVGLRVSVPVFTGGAISRDIEASEARHRGAEEAVRLEESRVSGELDRALSALEETRARVASLEVAVARSAEVVRIEQLRTETGTGTQTDYLKAEADLLEARAGLVEARHGELAARVELARLTGALDLTWLRENLEETR